MLLVSERDTARRAAVTLLMVSAPEAPETKELQDKQGVNHSHWQGAAAGSHSSEGFGPTSDAPGNNFVADNVDRFSGLADVYGDRQSLDCPNFHACHASPLIMIVHRFGSSPATAGTQTIAAAAR